MQALVRYVGVTEKEAARIQEAKEFLFTVRNALHVLAGEERDQLVVTRQEQVAALLGYGSDEGTPRVPQPPRPLVTEDAESPDCAPPVERFMRDYYAHANAVHQVCREVMHRSERDRIFLGIGLELGGAARRAGG